MCIFLSCNSWVFRSRQQVTFPFQLYGSDVVGGRWAIKALIMYVVQSMCLVCSLLSDRRCLSGIRGVNVPFGVVSIGEEALIRIRRDSLGKLGPRFVSLCVSFEER